MEKWKHIRSVLLLPVTATVAIPATLLFFMGIDTLGLWDRFTIGRFVLPILGVLFVAFGLVQIAESVLRHTVQQSPLIALSQSDFPKIRR